MKEERARRSDTCFERHRKGTDMIKILVIVTNSATLGDTEGNGTFAPEITHALHVFKEAGYGHDLVSIRGGNAPIYGLGEDDPVNQAMLADGALVEAMAATQAVAGINPDEYQAVYYPGGFGLLNDLANDTHTAAITASLYDGGAIVGAVCHGPAGLLEVTLSDGSNIMKGKAVTCFTRKEEIAYGTIEQIPFVLEDAVTAKAGAFKEVDPWGENVVVQDRLVTGQNPASAESVGREMVKLLNA
jgi:putative intracellular protease/amidase